MAEVEISSEDREILAKTKFKQWFDECFTETFGGAFDKRLIEVHEAAGTKPETRTTTTVTPNPNNSPTKQRKRSLFDMALSDTFGL